MEMTSTIPEWLTPVAWIYLALALISAGVIIYDIAIRGYRGRVRAMDAIWPITALFLGPVALLMYFRWARPQTAKWEGQQGPALRPGAFQRATVACLPGAAASTVAHIVGVPIVFSAGWTIAGLALWAVALFILILATVLLFVFELVAASNGQPVKTSGRKIGATALIALATVILFDIGMVGWMVFLHVNNFMPPPTNVVFTFQMQIGMVLGMITAYPLVAWLTGRRTAASATTAEPGISTPELVRP